MKTSATVLLALAGSAFAIPANQERQKCNEDNCLRALLNTKRPGVADCSSYFQATFTPATITYTETSSFTVTPTDTVDVTQTITEFVTETVYEDVVQTDTTTVDTTIKPWKRQATAFPSAIPSYASACSGVVRYTSACSCLGFSTYATVTVEAPTTWVTVSTTQTEPAETVTQTVQTDVATITDATETLPTIVSTVTVTVPNPVATITDFKLKVNSDSAHKDKFVWFKPNAPTGAGALKGNLQYTADESAATRFSIDAAGNLIAPNGRPLSIPAGAKTWYSDTTNVQTFPTLQNDFASITCHVDTNSRSLACDGGNGGQGVYIDCGDKNEVKWWTGVKGPLRAECLPINVAVVY